MYISLKCFVIFSTVAQWFAIGYLPNQGRWFAADSGISNLTCILIKNSYLGWFLDLWHKISGNLDVLAKKGLHIRIQQEKNHQNDQLLYLGFEKVLKMQASDIYAWCTWIFVWTPETIRNSKVYTVPQNPVFKGVNSEICSKHVAVGLWHVL